MDWRDIQYLQNGNERQQRVFACLRSSRILEGLASFDPVVVSTICLDIDIPASDIDIICFAPELAEFEHSLQSQFSSQTGYQLCRRNPECVLCRFEIGGFTLEIFGCGLQVEQQQAYRHMSVTARLVSLGGNRFREKVRNQKLLGVKTEPAIAKILHLRGDPYHAVLELESKTDQELSDLIELADSTEIQPSKISGKGVFARRRFRAGEIVLCWDTSRKVLRADAHLLPEPEQHYLNPYDGEHFVLLPEPERYVNHSCESNTCVQDFCDVAKRDIKAGEEITSDYCSGGGVAVDFECRCGSINCVHRVS